MSGKYYRAIVEWYDSLTKTKGTYIEPNKSGYGSLWMDDDGINTFMWDEGNYACDCNRASFFIGDEDHKCSEDRFHIISIHAISDDGQKIDANYMEDPAKNK